MAGTISEFFGYRATDSSAVALKAVADKKVSVYRCSLHKGARAY